MKVLGKANLEPKLDKGAIFMDPRAAAIKWLKERKERENGEKGKAEAPAAPAEGESAKK